MNLSSFLFFILFFSYSAFGQNIQTTEVNIVEEYTPKIIDGKKINDRAEYNDSLSSDRLQKYDFFDFTLQSNYKTKLLAPATIKDPLLTKLYANSICFGFGNYWKTKADIIYNSTRSINKSYGIHFHHYSDKYLPAKNSKNSINAFYKRIYSSNTYKINLSYDRRTAFYEQDRVTLIKENFRNRFALTKLSLNIYSNKNINSRINHNTHIFISDFNEFSENHFHVSSQIRNLFKNLPITIRTRFDSYLNYNSSSSYFKSSNVNYFDFSPNYALNKHDIDMSLGFNFVFKSTGSNFYLMPNVKFSKELVKDIITIETGFLQSHIKNSLQRISAINPYIHSYEMNQSIDGTDKFNQSLNFTKENKFYFSLSNILSENEMLKTSFGYSSIDNFMHFIRIDNPSYLRYASNYIDLSQYNLDIEYFNKINSLLSLEFTCEIYKWNKEVFNNPSFKCDLQTPLSLRKKIKIIPSILYFSKKRFVAISNNQIATPYVFQIDREVGPYLYVNLLLEYNYSEYLSAFLNFYNITNNTKDIWLGYDEQGLNMLFGIRTSF